MYNISVKNNLFMHLCHELLLFLTKYIPCIIALYSPRIIFLVTFPNQDEQVKYHGVGKKALVMCNYFCLCC
jgi:hypothetical protein